MLLCFVVWYFQGQCLMAAFWFAVLLNLKHIFIYVAPAYFVYLLRSYCFVGTCSGCVVQWKSFSSVRFAKLGLVVASVFLVSFGPFIVLNQLPQVINNDFQILSVQQSVDDHWSAIYERLCCWQTFLSKCTKFSLLQHRNVPKY